MVEARIEAENETVGSRRVDRARADLLRRLPRAYREGVDPTASERRDFVNALSAVLAEAEARVESGARSLDFASALPDPRVPEERRAEDVPARAGSSLDLLRRFPGSSPRVFAGVSLARRTADESLAMSDERDSDPEDGVREATDRSWVFVTPRARGGVVLAWLASDTGAPRESLPLREGEVPLGVEVCGLLCDAWPALRVPVPGLSVRGRRLELSR